METEPPLPTPAIYDRQTLMQAIAEAQTDSTRLKNLVTDEIRRRAVLLLSKDPPGLWPPEWLTWPEPLQAWFLGPTVLAVTWPQPNVDPKYQIFCRFEF